MNHETIPERFQNERVWDRYRAVFEETGRNSESFYPDVGIAPVSNGGLFVAARHIAEKIGLPVDAEPRCFLETLALTNWAKFTIHENVNQDYIDDPKRPIESLPYVIAELSLLRPAVVLIPKAIWNHPIHRAAMRGASPKTKFLPIPQFNAQVVNCHLRGYERQAQDLKIKLAHDPIDRWMDELKNVNRSHAWRYLAFLESLPLGNMKSE